MKRGKSQAGVIPLPRRQASRDNVRSRGRPQCAHHAAKCNTSTGWCAWPMRALGGVRVTRRDDYFINLTLHT
jgi:hypothetical protein